MASPREKQENSKVIDMLNEDIKEIKGDVKDLSKGVMELGRILAGNYVQKGTCEECQRENNAKHEEIRKEIKNNFISLLVLIFGIAILFAGALAIVTKSIQLTGWVLSIGSIAVALLSIVAGLIKKA